MRRSLRVIPVFCACMLLLTSCDSTQKGQQTDTQVVQEEQARTEYIMPIPYRTTEKGMENLLKFNTLNERDLNNKLYPYSFYNHVNVYAERTAYTLLYNAIYEFQDKLDLSALNITTDTFMAICSAMYNDNPDFYYLDTEKIEIVTKAQSDTDSALYVDYVLLKYKQSKESVEENTKRLQDVVSVVRQAIPEDLSVYDTYVYLNDFIVLNTLYADDAEYPNEHIGALLEGETQCLGFARAYLYLCRELDMPCAIAMGSFGLSHAWNVIPYDDGWMTIDVGMNNVDSEIPDWVQHAYMGYTEQKMTEKLGYVVDRQMYNAPMANKEISFYDKLGDTYKVTSTDIETGISEIADMVVRAKEQGRNYVEVTAYTDEVLPVLRERLLTTSSTRVYDILDKAAEKLPTIDTERVGIVPLKGTHTVVLYVFDKEERKEG